MTLTTLVTGASAAAREAAIAARFDVQYGTALILEGIPDGLDPLERFQANSDIRISRIAAGCVCCTGNLTLRVTLNRILRRAPQRLYLSLATVTHLEQVRRFLTQAPYDALLELTTDLHV
jgi:hypothetical protein